jgi:hypothetical protein
VTPWGRWLWGLSGLATAAVLTVPAVRALSVPALSNHPVPAATLTRTVPVTAPVTSLNVQTQGSAVRVRAGSGHTVQVTERIDYDKTAGPPPAITDSVTGGRLTLADPSCATTDCGVSFDVTVPSTVFAAVTSNGGFVTVSGTAGAEVDSGGAPAILAGLHGPVTVGTDGGELRLAGLTGTVHADTGGGPLDATGIHGTSVITTDGGELNVRGLTGTLQADSGQGPADLRDVTSPAVTVTTGGGEGYVQFAAAPQSVTLSTDGGPAQLVVPGGPYALTTDSDDGPESVHIPTDPSAARTLTVTSGGGPLTVSPVPAR